MSFMPMSLFLLLTWGCEADSGDADSDEVNVAGERVGGEGSESTSADPGELSWGNAEGEYAQISGTLRAEDSDRGRGQLVIQWDGEDVTADAEWSSSDMEIIKVEVVDGVAVVSALSAGTATVTAVYQEGQLDVEVSAIAPASIELKGPRGDVVRGETFSLDAQLVWSDDSIEDLSDELRDTLTWESTTGAAQVEEGEVTITAFGQVEVTVSATTDLGATISGSWGVEVPCAYPEPSGRSFNASLELNTVLPPIKWNTAYSAMDGSTSEISMEEVYCSDEYNWVNTITFMVTAGWCTACPSYMRAVADMSDELLEAGGLLIYVEVQDYDGAPADSAFAQEHLSDMLGSTNGYFVGDMETQPLTRFFGRSSAIEAFPDAYVVRRSDMTIMTSLNLNRQAGLLPFIAMAEDPAADWTNIMPPPFESLCEEGDDEVSEPNDDPVSAGLIEPGVHTGAICNEGPDYYRIDVEGNWRFLIEFSHREADIDIASYVPGNPSPTAVSNGTADMEELTGTGPAIIQVVSYTNTSTTYTITLEAQ